MKEESVRVERFEDTGGLCIQLDEKHEDGSEREIAPGVHAGFGPDGELRYIDVFKGGSQLMDLERLEVWGMREVVNRRYEPGFEPEKIR